MTAYIAELGPEHAPWKWALAFDYDPVMVDAIKGNIPARQRTWKPDLKQWWFRAGCLVAIEVLARRHCGAVVYLEDSGAGEAQLVPAETAAAYRTLHLQPTAPPELVKAAYRVMCKLHHPDVGGTTAQMQRVNEAYGLLAQHSKEATS